MALRMFGLVRGPVAVYQTMYLRQPWRRTAGAAHIPATSGITAGCLLLRPAGTMAGVDRGVYTRLVEDLLALLVLPVTDSTPPRPGGWQQVELAPA